MNDEQRQQIAGMDRLLQKFNIYSEDTTFTVRDILKASNEVYNEILIEAE